MLYLNCYAFTWGLTISIAGIILFISFCVTEYVLRKKRSKLIPDVVGDEIYWELEDFDFDDEEYKTTPKPNGFLEQSPDKKFKLKNMFKKKSKSAAEKSDTENSKNENTDANNDVTENSETNDSEK